MNQQSLIDEIADEIISDEYHSSVSESELEFLKSLRNFVSGRLARVSDFFSNKATPQLRPRMIQFPPADRRPPKPLDERAILESAISAGNRSENGLTDILFSKRYPHLKNTGIQRNNPAYHQLSSEWIAIRNTLVRPRLRASSLEPVPASGPSPQTSPGSDVQTLRVKVADVASKEWASWGYGVKTEYQEEMQKVILRYWREGPGYIPADLKDPWSAAFISWVVKKAGADNHFKASGAHTTYTYHAKQNRLQNLPNCYKAYSISELRPIVGDIVINNRAKNTFTYENIRPNVPGTHGDIVVSVGSSSIKVIGGNKGNKQYPKNGVTVNQRTLLLNQQGLIDKAGYFAILRLS